MMMTSRPTEKTTSRSLSITPSVARTGPPFLMATTPFTLMRSFAALRMVFSEGVMGQHLQLSAPRSKILQYFNYNRLDS